MIGIYKIENKINGKIYIGQSNNIKTRWIQHLSALNNGIHNNRHLQCAWNKYGESNFEFSVIEECNSEDLNSKEIYYIDFYNSYISKNGYNLTFGGDGGKTLEPEMINKIYELYNDGFIATEISKELHIHIKTIYKYLKIGTKNNLCNYDVNRDMFKLHSKKIVCLNTQKVYDSIKDAENEYNITGIYECCIHKVNYVGKDNNGNELFWMYYDEYNSMSLDEIDTYITNLKIKFDYRIVCINNGKIFKNYKDANEFAGLTGKQSITNCCLGKKHRSGKNKETNEYYTWAYYKDYIHMSDEEKQDKISNAQILYNEKKVICLNNLKIFPSPKFAVKWCNNTNIESIKLCCRGKIKTTGEDKDTYTKLKWMYYDDYIKIKNIKL